MNYQDGGQFSGLVGTHPAGSKPKTQGNGAEHWGEPYRARLADRINSAKGMGDVKITRPKPGSWAEGGDY
jgi:hypothetical protein